MAMSSSFHTQSVLTIPSVTSPGRDSGTAMRRKIPQWPQPSSRAASNSETGSRRKKPVRK